MRHEIDPRSSSGRISSSRIADRYRDEQGDLPLPDHLRGEPPSRFSTSWILVAALAALAGVLGALLLTRGDDSVDVASPGGETAEEVAPGDTASDGGGDAQAGGDGAPTATATDDGAQDGEGSGEGPGDEGQSDRVGEPADAFPAPLAPFVQATLAGPELQLSGSVPSAELAAGIEQAAQIVYAPFVTSTITVDESLPDQPWLAATPRAVMLLQTITEGTMLVSEGQVSITGNAASTNDVDQLGLFVTEATGLPVTNYDIAITNLRPAVYVIAATGGRLALSGALPSAEIQQGLSAAANEVYGEENVFDASTVDPTVAPALWMYNPIGLMATVASFPEFEVRLDGGAFTASLSGGSTFASGSTEFAPEFAQILNFGIVVLLRDPAMSIRVEGHTDSQGSDETNLVLSQARADAVAAYFIGGGVEQERITAVGVGEAEPVADNSTAEGRARNRRIEFVLETPG